MFSFQNNLEERCGLEIATGQRKAEMIINEVSKVVKLTHFERNRPLRIICDASKQAIGEVLH